MEQMTQKFLKYFDITLVAGIILQLLDVVVRAITGGIGPRRFALVALSIANLVLLIGSLKHSNKQQFIECKLYAKVLRFTIVPLVALQAILCFIESFNGIILGDYLMSIIMIELVLTHKIKCIEYLEKLADQYVKDKELEQKGE